MSSKTRYITYLLSLVLFIYIMRQTDLSSSEFLSHQILRITEEEKLSASICAGGYDDITVSASQKTSADSYRSGFKSMRGDKSLSSFIANDEPIGTFVMDYSKTYIPYIMPWAIFFVIALVGWLTYSCNWCFMYVPPLKRRVWNCCRRPKTPRFKNLFVILSSLFMLFSIGAGIAGIVLMSKFKTYTYGTECSTVKFVEAVQDGSEEDKWIGVATAIDVLDTAVNNISETINSTSIYDTLLAGYNQDLNAMLTTLNDLYDQFKSRGLDRISTSGGTYQPMYITELGPVDESGTALNAIAGQLNGGFDILSSNQESLNSFRASATQDTDSTIQSVMSNRPVLVTANDTLTKILNEISDHQSLIKTIINVSNGAVKGLFIANLSIGAAAILAILLVCFGARVFNKGVHLSWCLLGVLTIVGWAIAAGLFATTLLVAEGCDVANLALTNPLFFNQTFDKIAHAFNVNNKDTDDTRNILYRCVFGDGDLATQFNLTSNLAMFDPIFTKINEISSDTLNSINSLPTGLAAEAQGLLDKFVTGYYPDSVETVTDLVELNLVTNSALNPCTSVQDQWALNLVNCSGQTVFQPDSPVDFNVGGSTCIPYDNWAAQPRDINLRYTPDRFDGFLCLSMNDRGTAVGFINNLVRNRDETKQLLAEIGQQVNVLDGQFTSFIGALQETPKMLKQTNASVDMIYMALADNNTGLIANANCQYMVESAWELVDVACGGAGIVIFQSTVAFLVMSFVALFGTLFLFCLAKRFIVEKPYKKTDPRLYAKDTSMKAVKNKVTVD